MFYQEHTICVRKDLGNLNDIQLYFTTGQNLNRLVLLSTTLNHKDIAYHRQIAASSNSKNTCNILFNTGILPKISSKPLEEEALSLMSDSMPQTCVTARKSWKGRSYTHMHACMHSVAYEKHSHALVILQNKFSANLLGGSCLGLGNFVWFIFPKKTSKKNQTKTKGSFY